MRRITHGDFHVQFDEVETIARRFKVETMLFEANALGDPLKQDFLRCGLHVAPFVRTLASMAKIYFRRPR